MKRPTLEQFRAAAKATGGNLSRIAGIFGVSRGTLYSWMKNPGFEAVINEERGRLVDEAIEAARLLSIGNPVFDENGRFHHWAERPDGPTLRWILGTFGRAEGFTNETSVAAKVNLEELSDQQLDAIAKNIAQNIKI